MLLTKYNLSRLIDRMCAAGLVARSPVEDDGRGPHIGISEAGRCMQKRMCPVYARGIAQHFADQLEEQEIVELGRILQKLQ